MKFQTDAVKEIIIQSTLIFLLCTLFFTNAFSQNRTTHSQLEIRTGITIGSPIVTKNIPEGATGSPGIGLNGGLEYTYSFHPKFSLTIGAAYAKKSSSFASPVNGKYDAARGIFGQKFPFPVKVKYTGDVEARFSMTYLDFPVLVNIHLKKWRLGLGYQYSKMINGSLEGSVDVKAIFLDFNDQAFDESENIKDYDNSILLKVRRQLTNRIGVAADFVVSTQRLMIESEEGFSNPRNVFVNVLVGFRLF